MDPVASLKRAWGLYQSDSRLDTIVAIGIAVTVLGPLAGYMWRFHQSRGGFQRN